MSKQAALVTLTGSLSLVVGRHRFEKNKTVRVSDPALIEALQADGSFVVNLVKEDAGKAEKPAAKAATPKTIKEPSKTAEDKEAPTEGEEPKADAGKGAAVTAKGTTKK